MFFILSPMLCAELELCLVKIGGRRFSIFLGREILRETLWLAKLLKKSLHDAFSSNPPHIWGLCWFRILLFSLIFYFPFCL